MLIRNLLLVCFGFISAKMLLGQELPYNSRKWDLNWTYIKFEDQFNGSNLDINKWNLANDGTGNCVFLDSVNATYSVTNGCLNLNMIQNCGYKYVNNNGDTICPDFLAASVITKMNYKYGIYEGRMKFAGENGSWPAFWTFGNSDPETPYYAGFKSEIDIAEHNWRKNWLGISSCSTDHVLHWWWDPNIYGTEQMSIPEGLGTDKNNLNWSNFHTFKLIYTPYYIKIYIDGNLSFQRSRYFYWVEGNDIEIEDISNYGYYGEYTWFPKHSMNLILSQQVCDADDINGETVSPQTSFFDWVTIRNFFLSPQITVSEFICSNSGTASLDVDTLASNIAWSLQPSGFFQTSSGSGKNVNISALTTAHGQATITYTFYMPSGEQFTASKDFWVGQPNYYVRVTFPGGGPVPTNSYGEPVACPNTDYVFSTHNNLNDCYATNHSWQFPQEWSVNYNNGYEISINTNDEPYGTMYVDAKDCCYDDISLSLGLEINENCGSYRLSFAPNPSTYETTMTIESVGTTQQFNESLSWDVEIMDQMQALKVKKSKLKGKELKINTSGWKEGIYVVHVNYDGKDIIGKLSVKK